MRRRPPGSTRTDTLFPYTTLFRSLRIGVWHVNAVLGHAPLDELVEPRELVRLDLVGPAVLVAGRRAARLDLPAAQHGRLDPAPKLAAKVFVQVFRIVAGRFLNGLVSHAPQRVVLRIGSRLLPLRAAPLHRTLCQQATGEVHGAVELVGGCDFQRFFLPNAFACSARDCNAPPSISNSSAASSGRFPNSRSPSFTQSTFASGQVARISSTISVTNGMAARLASRVIDRKSPRL